jgi:ElaB/YqjD/DUF883 family membrane-anchored ribosome-binding protein
MVEDGELAKLQMERDALLHDIQRLDARIAGQRYADVKARMEPLLSRLRQELHAIERQIETWRKAA